MSAQILDLDNLSNYEKRFEHIIYRNEFCQKLVEDYHGAREIYNQFSAESQYISEAIVNDLQCECSKFLFENYSHVTGYHACRTNDSSKYKEQGLVSASKEFLYNMVKEIVEDDKGLSNTLEKINGERYGIYIGSISMYISAKFASPEYLTKGSHYLRMVGYELNSEAQEKLRKYHQQTEPKFVKCKIPILWFKNSEYIKSYREPYLLYVGSIIRRYIHALSGDQNQYEEDPESILIFKDIPPEDIEEILDADACLHWNQTKQT